MSKVHIYFMPGLAASSSIFEKIKLPVDVFEIHLLDWIMPEKSETLTEYAERMSKFVKHDKAVLIGVSFGGILVQEMAQFLDLRKIIIISSVKSNKELPSRMKIAKTTKAYKLIPTSLLANVETLTKYAFGTMIKERLKLYKKYLTMKDKAYLDWAIEQVVCWERTIADKNVIHIHGDNDSVFPVQNIKEYINVNAGTHIMIVNRYKWFNENLPDIILK
ncbi:MAG: alpha/beta hydrolase [Flavobacterium sp.]|uniref:alpha/beta hydrolase n=1 Tax=Flavobacterium sp. TaxID=239 RepID=UPI0032646B35